MWQLSTLRSKQRFIIDMKNSYLLGQTADPTRLYSNIGRLHTLPARLKQHQNINTSAILTTSSWSRYFTLR